MISGNNTHKKNIAILISPGFTENEVVYCLSQMRAAGLSTTLVGATNSLVKSQHGLIVQPDLTLRELTPLPPFHMLIIPGSYECVSNLLTSPDFHFQVEKSVTGDGHVVIFNSAETALKQVAPFATPTEKILYQQQQPLESFCQQLIHTLMAV
ncbi:MAG: DJ-1/PfpI family protein [Ardenticatenaceae bacterium]|nr:DJ-1/PfpI family protein [Anaerolineales bacterium]MCB8979266.1 DJ-1/PfpI family protein [Ardenticatenaceae bacterium]